MASKTSKTAKTAAIVSRNAEKASLARLERKVLDSKISNSLIVVLDAERSAADASASLQQTAKDTAQIWWNTWNPKPANGEAMNAAVASIKKGAEADGIKAQYAENAWNNAFSHVSNYLYLLMLPTVQIESPRKKDKGEKINAAKAGTNFSLVTKLAAAARKAAGTGRTRSASHTAPTAHVVSAQAISEKQAASFEVNTKSVLSLIERVLSMDSGIGLISDALKVHGWIVVPSAERKAQQDAENAAMQLKRKSAELAEAAKAALLARQAKRRGKANSK